MPLRQKMTDWLLSLPLFHVSGQGIFWRWLLGGGASNRAVSEHPLAQALHGLFPRVSGADAALAPA